jgi:catechol 2,3-dioxygenase-like lactoylglutathione lyase family enzyme
MLSTARVVPTLAVSDMDRARRIYQEGLGLAVEMRQLPGATDRDSTLEAVGPSE